MSVEEIESSLKMVVVAFSAAAHSSTNSSTNAKELFESMSGELEQVKFAYVSDGTAITRAANAIIFVCDKATIVTKFVELFDLFVGYDDEVSIALKQLHKEIIRLKLRP